MAYMNFHLQVRNDNHCPTCRQFFITLNDTLDDADRNSGCSESLRDGQSVWVDEWVRRRNGDLYQIIKVVPNELYDLSDNDMRNNLDNTNFSNQYMFLHIKIRKNRCCPDNIKFYISFHETLNEDELKMLEPVWIKKDECNGDHYQMIKLEPGKEMLLNSYCKYLNEKW